MKKEHSEIICTIPPSVEEIRELLLLNQRLKIKLASGDFQQEYIDVLQAEFPEHLVHEIQWLGLVIIEPSVSTEFVLKHLDLFKNAIIEFDRTANSMMQLLAEKFSIDLENLSELNDVKRNRSTKQRGELNEEWLYHFHGDACSFTNKISGQFLDVKVQYHNEYGFIDTYYLLQFINTSSQLSKTAALLENNISSMQKVLSVLETTGFLIKKRPLVDEKLVWNKIDFPA